ncbi:MAG: RIP metalloprotease RseP [Desulfovibrionaceae bacterium]|jgi:regulator of sigma E protease|nr:RIP metalloprotease RseP [Desulfovibrionaceae bacterium]
MLGAIAVIVVLGGLIFFHELGHFLAARLLGIGVKTFSLGFGRRLLWKKIGNTEYRLSAIPLGGYVNMVGESEDEEPPAEFGPDSSFFRRPPLHRILVAVAGPLFNLLLAWLIYWGLLWAQGQVELLPVIGQVRADSPAMAAGIEPGDSVTAIDGAPIAYWRDLSETIQRSQGRTLAMDIRRDGRSFTVQVRPELDVRKNIFGEEIRTPLIGIYAAGETVNVPLTGSSSAVAGLEQTWAMISITAQGFQKIIERIIPLETVGGPILIAQLVSRQAKQGVGSVLALAALISVNLGLLNLLPIPVLDGGHILFFTMEIVFRRPISQRVRDLATRVGLLLLLTLMALAFYNDIARIFS